MQRHYTILFMALALVALSLGSMVWSEKVTADRQEQLRQARSRQQLLEQQMSVLQTPGVALILAALEEDLDALKIRLVEVLTQLPRPAGVLSVDYEQTVLSPALDAVGSEPVSVLRLELRLRVQHAIGFQKMMLRINEAMVVWPNEIQACDVHRHSSGNLQVVCVQDFYHWNSEWRQASAFSGRLASAQENDS